MSSTNPLPMSSRLSVEEFHRQYEGQRAYLIDGEVIEMPAAGVEHCDSVNAVADWLRGLSITTPVFVRTEQSLKIDAGNDPQPDVVVLRGRRADWKGKQPTGTDALLVVEVADSSLRRDRSDKLPRYAAAGIVEVWIVDLTGRSLEVYREPDPLSGQYAPPKTFVAGDRLEALFAPEQAVDVAEFL